MEIQLAFAFQDIAPPQGQSAPAPAAAASTGAPQGAPPADPGFFGSPLFMLVMFVPLIAMMLWSSRSEQKRKQKVLSELKKGDIVLTQSGFRGKLVELGDRYAKVEIAPGTKVEVLKTAILGQDNAEAAAQMEKK